MSLEQFLFPLYGPPVLTRAMYDTMTAALREADKSPDVAVHLILGSGGVFTAGNDIQDFANRAVDLTQREKGASSLISTLPVLEKPPDCESM